MTRFEPEGTASTHALTHNQMQIWIGQRLHPQSPLYNMAFAFVFPTHLRPDLFSEAWRRVAGGSDALRTRVPQPKDGGLPEATEGSTPATTTLDFGALCDPEGEFLRWCRQRSSHPLPLEGELVESVLVRLGEARTGWYLGQHHLITDAASTLLLYRQVAAHYQALRRDDREPPALSPYYPTVAALESEESQALEHWEIRQKRPGRSVSLYGRSAEPVGTASARHTLELDEGRSRGLDELSRQDGFRSLSPDLSRFSLFATLLLSWLHRISGSKDLGFDAPVAGRPTSEAKRALGLFIEVFPFAATVEGNETFRSLGTKCLQEAMLFLRHARPGMSSPSGATASNVVLNYFPGAFGPFAEVPAQIEWVHPGHGDSVHALRLQVHDFSGRGRFTLHFDVNEGVLPEGLRRRAVEHFETMLDASLEDPDRPIASVDLRSGEERRAMNSLGRIRSAATDSPAPADRTVVEIFDAQADLVPERVALRQGDAELTFAELRERSEALAATLLAQGLEAGDRVAILSRRSIGAVVAILATLRARGAYVPIEATAPRARREHLLEDSGARILLTGEGVVAAPRNPEVRVLPIAEGIESGRGPVDLGAGPSLDDLAYLIYTSGSTGAPKGVLIGQVGLADYLGWASRHYVRGDRLTFPLFTSLAFDLTVTSLFLPLITGGTLEIYEEPDGPVDTALMDVVQANAVDFIKLTPSHLSWLQGMDLEGSRLQRMVVGGENLRTQLSAAISAQLGNRVEIYNEYGPTEAVVGCVVHRYDPRADTDASVPIGIPTDHVRVAILNEALTPVPAGVPGELWISRYGLARGYHGLERLTAEHFAPNPHPNPRNPQRGLDRSGERWYRTGDLVRTVDESTLEYLGRLDRQLKISGFRVEPGEIETALLSMPGIERCVVVPWQQPAAAPPQDGEIHHCTRCGLPSNYPSSTFDSQGVCHMCRSYESTKAHAQAYFKSMDDLRAVFEESARRRESRYDCMMLLSGGKDSTYALCQLVEMGLSVYAFTLDNGFIAEGAKENIRKVTGQLGVAVEFGTTPAMNAIFRDSLMRFSNVCNGCFKAIYTLSMQRARELEIPIIVTGLSRGQMFETRLTEEVFRDGQRSPEEIDAAVLAARKVYHRLPDEVSRSLDVRIFQDDQIFEEIQFIDFYRYCDVGMDTMYSYLRRQVPWVRPKDTGRSTNCLINDTGIYIHKKERGFHNYALPYSWDVRLGHKTRQAALGELDDDIDESAVREILAEVGYDLETRTADQATLEAFYVASEGVSDRQLRRHLGEHLSPHLIPTRLRRVDSIPLTASGKVDVERLSREAHEGRPKTPYRPPEGPVEEYLTQVWQEELHSSCVGADDHFFELGGTSLAAIQVMLRLGREFDIDLPLDGMFSHPKLSALARVAEEKILEDVEGMAGEA